MEGWLNMTKPVFYTPDENPAIRVAVAILRKDGYIFEQAPSRWVTHLLLGVPAFREDGCLKNGMNFDTILSELKEKTVVVGGNLNTPSLVERTTVDLLKDPMYLAKNAQITAHCAVKVALSQLSFTLTNCPVLIVGWGRIGKCLAALLRSMGAQVTVYARKETDIAMLGALGYDAKKLSSLAAHMCHYRVIFNTVPAPVISEELLSICRDDCLKIDLASEKSLAGKDVLWARGLPGKEAPESSGALIAETITRLIV